MAGINVATLLSKFISVTLILQKATALKNLSISLMDLPTNNYGLDSLLLCVNSSLNIDQIPNSIISCSNGVPLMDLGYCATYDNETKLLFIAKTPYYLLSSYNITSQHIQLPANLSQLNDYMCGPLNRKGRLCGKCIDGFGPSVTSFNYKCANCNHTWYGVLLFLFLEFVPLTIFYLIILVFRIRMTSAPMPCFIIYSQFIISAINLTIYGELIPLRSVMFAENGALRMIIKIIGTIYGIFNLDFFRLVLPPFCVSSQLKDIHIAFLGYISVFYPMFLIFLTWVCIQLHDHNFRPLVLLWKPFHRCCVQLRRGWNTKNDICDVFATFFLLSYSKTFYLTILLMTNQLAYSINALGNYTSTLQPVLDHSIRSQDMNYLIFAIPSAVLCFVFNLLPLLLLVFYPLGVFRQFLERCHLDFAFISFFVVRFQSHYQNGLDGRCDMRSYSGLYFSVVILAFLGQVLNHHFSYFNPFFLCGTLFLVTAFSTALTRPYQGTRMNIMDSLLLANIAIICYLISSDDLKVLIDIIVLVPVATLTLLLLQSKYCKISHDHYFKCTPNNICHCMKKQNYSIDSHIKEQSLLQPSIVNIDITQYGAC